MLITVQRFASDAHSTGSIVLVDGHFHSFGLEDEFRTEKVWGETRIPAGKYHVGIRTEGGFHGRYSRRFPGFHQGMLQVLNVPNFEYVLIHVGNTDDDTAGCLLVGKGIDFALGRFRLSSSAPAYTSLYQKVIHAALAGDLSIEFEDLDQ